MFFLKKGGIFLQITGIICEYNPLHLGHAKQIHTIRARYGAESGIVCLMSGNFVQRGSVAIVDKSLRAKAAILSGADLVLELPVTASLSSAEGFADYGVGILSGFCSSLCFGAETPDPQQLYTTARALLSEDFTMALRCALDTGVSFPAARQLALETMGISPAALSKPNNILAVEYCKAILRRESTMKPMPILRRGSYHAEEADSHDPSATALRRLLLTGQDVSAYLPAAAQSCFADAPLHTLAAGERAILAMLRTMTDAEFESVPYGSEGLWRKLMHESRRQPTLEDILTAVKSKRYTRTRLDRMVMCAFLGITQEMLSTPAPYVRVLAFNDTGRTILKQARATGTFLNAGESTEHPYWAFERHVGSLYGLFTEDTPDSPDIEVQRRVYYHNTNV